MDNQVHNQIVSFIWGIADDCLRDIYTDKTKTYSYSELYQVQNVGNIGQLKSVVRMHNHLD